MRGRKRRRRGETRNNSGTADLDGKPTCGKITRRRGAPPVETRIFSAFSACFLTRVCDSRSLSTRIGSLCSPSYSPYFKTPFSIFPGLRSLLYAPQSAPSCFGLISSLFSSRNFPIPFPRAWLGLFRFSHVLLYSSHVSRAPPAPADREASSLFPFPHSLILCAAGV